MGRYKPNEVLRINEGITSYSFPQNESWPDIKAIILPESCGEVTSCKEEITNAYPNLQEIVWPNIKKSQEKQFMDCKKLKYFQSFSCEKLSAGMFMNSGLIKISLPDKCKRNIPMYCFAGCSHLKSFDFKDSETIGECAFMGTGLKSIVLEFSDSDNNRIDGSAFSHSDVEYVKITGYAKFGQACFKRCTKLKCVELNSSITDIPRYTFCLDDNLTTILNVNGVISVDSFSFSHCSLETIDNFSNLKKIGEGAFSYCKQLKSVKLGVAQIGEKIFSNCNNLKRVVFNSPEMCSLFPHAFDETEIEYLDLENTSITAIISEMFLGLPLKEIRLPETLTTICEKAFGYTKLTKIDIPSSVSDIWPEVFIGCEELESVTWSPNCKTVSYKTFYCCHNLKNINQMDSIKVIGNNAFEETNLDLSLPNLESFTEDAFCGYNGMADLRNSAVVIDVNHPFSNMDHVLLPYYYK